MRRQTIRFFFLILLCLCLSVPGLNRTNIPGGMSAAAAAQAEDSQEETSSNDHGGKTRGEFGAYFSGGDQTLPCFYEQGDQSIRGYGITIYTEDVTSLDCTFLEGVKPEEGFISLKQTEHASFMNFDMSAIPSEGTAVFHIAAESESYYTDFDMTLTFAPRDSEKFTLDGNVIDVPLNQRIRLGKTQIVKSDFEGTINESFLTPDKEDSMETPEYLLEYGTLTIKTPGEYEFCLLLSMPINGSEIFVPVTVRADDSYTEVSASGEAVVATVNGVFPADSYESGSAGNEVNAEGDSGASGQSMMDAFDSLDDPDDESDEDTVSLDDLDSAANTPEPADSNEEEELSEEELALMLAGAVEDALNDSKGPEELDKIPVQKEAFLEAGTELHRNGMFLWPMPESFSLVQSTSDSAMSGSVPIETNTEIFSDGTDLNYIFSKVYSFDDLQYIDNADAARNIYGNFSASVKNEWDIVSEQEITLDGNQPAYVCIASKVLTAGLKWYQQVACHLWYARGNNTVLYLYYSMYSGLDSLYDEATIPSIEDFMPLLSQITYSMPENRAGIQDWLITKDDLELILSAKPDQHLLSTGGNIKFSAEFKNAALIKKMKNLQKTVWLLLDPEQYAEGKVAYIDSSLATIDQNGNLKAGNAVQDAVEVGVVAFSSNASTLQVFPVVLLPKVNKITINENSISMYVGDSLTLTGAFEPENAFYYSEEYGGNTAWSVDNTNAVLLADRNNGTAVIQALAAGRASVTLKDILSGKQARANIQVLVPVEEVTVTGPDTVSAGKKASFKAEIAPKNAGNKKLRWTIDADESIAAMDKNGNLTVKKTAEAGTSITITCTAEGAATEISAEKTVTVQ